MMQKGNQLLEHKDLPTQVFQYQDTWSNHKLYIKI